MDKIDTWIKERFGTPNTFNRQLLDNFIEFLEKELGYVIKDPDQSLPMSQYQEQMYPERHAEGEAQRIMRKEGWVKIKEKSNG